MTGPVHVPYTVEQDEDDVCGATRSSARVWGERRRRQPRGRHRGPREALEGLIAEFGPPQELTLTVDVA